MNFFSRTASTTAARRRALSASGDEKRKMFSVPKVPVIRCHCETEESSVEWLRNEARSRGRQVVKSNNVGLPSRGALRT